MSQHWHGWATPDNVYQMMDEMVDFLVTTENDDKLWLIKNKIYSLLIEKRVCPCRSMMLNAPNAEN